MTDRVLTEIELPPHRGAVPGQRPLAPEQRGLAAPQGELPRPVPPGPGPLFRPRSRRPSSSPATRRCCARLGYAREALLGKPYTKLLPPASRAAYLRRPTVLSAARRNGDALGQGGRRRHRRVDRHHADHGCRRRLRPLAQRRPRRDRAQRLANALTQQGGRTGAGQRASCAASTGTGGVHLRRLARPQGAVAHAWRRSAPSWLRTTAACWAARATNTSTTWSRPAAGSAS